MTSLCNIMTKCGSDKGSYHNYTTIYYDYFNDISNNNLNIFELGLGTNYTDIPSSMGPNGKPGASLYGWKEFFPNSNIYGADIDKRILFNDDRIKTYFCDQTNIQIINNLWNNIDLINLEFDIILDDGLHEFNANLSFFENSFYKLKKGGKYIIEDLFPETINKFENIKEQLIIKHDILSFEVINLVKDHYPIDNSLLVISK
tara:strand:+ start:3100 stop:3705 length:606 start_codon:yes stop_codon:yes gene_type:complete